MVVLRQRRAAPKSESIVEDEMKVKSGEVKWTRISLVAPVAALLAVPLDRALFGWRSRKLVSRVLLSRRRRRPCGLITVFSGSRVPILTNAAELMLDRTVNSPKNWQKHPLRSFVELAAWLQLTFHLHDVFPNVVVSAPLGALCGFGMVVLCDALNWVLRLVERSVMRSSPHLLDRGDAHTRRVCLRSVSALSVW